MGRGRIVVDGEAKNLSCQPKDIDTSVEHFWNAFDHHQTEISAKWVVRFLQKLGKGWEPFTYKELNDYYQNERKSSNENFCFNRLVESSQIPANLAEVTFGGLPEGFKEVGGGWIVLCTDKKYRVTDDFILRCHTSAPVKTK